MICSTSFGFRAFKNSVLPENFQLSMGRNGVENNCSKVYILKEREVKNGLCRSYQKKEEKWPISVLCRLS